MQQIVEQKLRLLDNLLGSAKFRQILEGADSAAKSRLQSAIKLREEARAASNTGDFAKAAPLLDDALKTSTSASAMVNKGETGLDSSLLISQNKELLGQIQDYRKSITDHVAKTGKKSPETMGEINRKIQAAESLTALGRHGDANLALAEGYKLAVAALTKFREGDVVIIDLKFETPADEFDYEIKRFQSHQMLVDMILAEQDRYSEATRYLIVYKLEEGRGIKSTAEKQAAEKNFAAAIKTMEDATEQLIRALRIGGMSVF